MISNYHKNTSICFGWDEERKLHDVQSVLEVLVGASPTSAEEVSISFRPNSSFCSHDLSYSSTGEIPCYRNCQTENHKT